MIDFTVGKKIFQVTLTELNKHHSGKFLAAEDKVILGNAMCVLIQNRIEGLSHTREKIVFSVYYLP